MSRLSSEEDPNAVSGLVEKSLKYDGLFLIPGLTGGALLGERILRLYGPEFPRGTTILVVRIVANLIRGYQKQLLSTLSGIDRPDLAFRVNRAFVVANLLLNVALTYLYGWLGAAVATAVSGGQLRTVARLRALDRGLLVPGTRNSVPGRRLCRHGVCGVRRNRIEETFALIRSNVVLVLALVVVGASANFASLLVLSAEFRETVARNLPFGPVEAP